MLDKVRTVEEAQRIAEHLHTTRRRLVFTNGCFELLHVGHIRYLQAARALGDALMVGLNSDESVRSLKGAPRPVVPQGERAELLAALGCVDYVVIFSELTAERLVATLRPDIYVKGGDYAAAKAALSGGGGAAGNVKSAPEMRVVQSYGGQVVVLPYSTGHSTTTLIENILKSYSGPAQTPPGVT